MKSIFYVMITALVVAGCNKVPEYSSPAGREFVVDTLFTHEGCTMYRFSDGGYSRYFAKCDGDSVTAQTEWGESCGKNCVRQREITTSNARSQ